MLEPALAMRAPPHLTRAGVFNAWGNVPAEGKLQILLIIFALEFATESKKPHYMRVSYP